jgi:hypothetical protein
MSSALALANDDLDALTALRLAELERLRDAGAEQLARLNRVTLGLTIEQQLAALAGPRGSIALYDRLARAIGQITVLEFELRGLFKAPDRDNPRKLRLARPGAAKGNLARAEMLLQSYLDRGDYSRGPLDEVVAGLRDTLGVAPPIDDPFAPPAERKAPATANTNRAVHIAPSRPEPPAEPAPAAIAPNAKSQMPQAKPALKAAKLAFLALGGKGFRKPPAKPKGPGPAPPSRKHRHNRGPPK